MTGRLFLLFFCFLLINSSTCIDVDYFLHTSECFDNIKPCPKTSEATIIQFGGCEVNRTTRELELNFINDQFSVSFFRSKESNSNSYYLERASNAFNHNFTEALTYFLNIGGVLYYLRFF